MQSANNRCRDDAGPPAEEGAGSGLKLFSTPWLMRTARWMSWPNKARELIEAPNAALVQTKHPVGSALLLKVGLKLVPSAEILATFGTAN